MKHRLSLHQLKQLMDSYRSAEDQRRYLQSIHDQFQLQRITRAQIQLQEHFQEQIRLHESVWEHFRQIDFANIQAQALCFEFAKMQAAERLPADLVASVQLLQESIRPLIDYSMFQALYAPPRILADQVNAAVAEARFLMELDLAEVESGKENEAVESGLIKIASPEVLDTLRHVDFVPFTLFDQILRDPENMRRLTPRQFEAFTAALLDRLGFEDVVLTPYSHDKGRDVLATSRFRGINIFFVFQCKRYAPKPPLGPECFRTLLGTIASRETLATKGVLVTTSYFTSGVREYILTEPRLDGVDFDGIRAWLDDCRSKNNK